MSVMVRVIKQIEHTTLDLFGRAVALGWAPYRRADSSAAVQ